MPAISRLRARDAAEPPFAPAIATLLIVLLALVILGVASVGALFLLRHVRRRRRLASPQPHDNIPAAPAMTSPAAFLQRKPSHKRAAAVTAAPLGPVHYPSADEKAALMGGEKDSRSSSPVPEIRITFPDEEGAKAGSRRSVVVTISDRGAVGLEPCRDEPAPPYQTPADGRFQSLDMERMGGLREKGGEKQWA